MSATTNERTATLSLPARMPGLVPGTGETLVNDLHSRLNETRVARLARPDGVDAVCALVEEARRRGEAISIAAGRHAMGGQQFGAGTTLLDTRSMDRVLDFDEAAGTLDVQAGIWWPALLEFLARAQAGRSQQWGIRQKQTGADRLSIGGALAANAHGRGLRLGPMIGDVESFTLVDAAGRVRTCSRTENSDLFALAIGGYGLFGVVTTVRLRLMRRRKVERLVDVIDIGDLVPAIERAIAGDCLYGDFQFAIDPDSEEFLRRGVFSRYRTLDDDAAMPGRNRALRRRDWMHLFHLAHEDKRRAFELYSGYYLSTSGQRYWSDTHQLSEYVDDYHRKLDGKLACAEPGTEMITEVYVPRDRLVEFMREAAGDLRASRADVIYGTVRFIERDDESFLAWAREPYACIIFNLHTGHSPAALAKTAGDFRRLVDRAADHGGSYYLTYHRWAARAQVERCHPRFARFLELKRAHDPEERFQSEWYRHYRAMFAGGS